MQKAALPKFIHEIGNHCTSTSIRDVFLYDGIEITEAAVFGLGSGMGFFYTPNPTYRFNGRALDLERKFYTNTGYEFAWAEKWSPQAIAESLEKGRPVLAKMDIFYLPYYQPPVHFVMHTVVVVEIDLNENHVRVADTASSEFLTLTLDEFQATINVDDPPMMYPYHYAAAPISKPVMNRENILRALYTVAKNHLTPEYEVEGLPAMRQLAEDFPAWKKADDWAWLARFAYQSLEKRGTGGGNFRLMYSDFLQEAGEFLPELTDIQAAERMQAIGQQWIELAQICKTIFVEENPAGFVEAGKLTAHLADLETRIMQDLLVTSQMGWSDL